MPIQNPSRVVQKLRDLQHQIRDAVIRSRFLPSGTSGVSRSSSADTIYQIDTVVDPILEAFCEEWGRETPLVLIAEGLHDERGREGPVVFPRGARADAAKLRVIVDPIDGTRGIMYDKRAAWALAGVAPNKGDATTLRDIEVAVMTELPTSKMAFSDVLWAVRGQGAHGVREKLDGSDEQAEAEFKTDTTAGHFRGRPLGTVLTGLGTVDVEHVAEALNHQRQQGGRLGEIVITRGYASEADVQIALAFQMGAGPATKAAPPQLELVASAGDALTLRPSPAADINHGFATVSNFFPGTKQLASELMEHLARNLLGPADVTRATVFDDQYISTGGQFYELIVGHDRFNADLRPAFYALQHQPAGLCCHPYDCATMLVAEEAGVILTDAAGGPLNGPLDTTTGLSWIGYANSSLRKTIEPLVQQFFASQRVSAR